MNKTTYLPKDLLQLIGQYHCRCGVLDCDIKPCACGTVHCDRNCCDKCKRTSKPYQKKQCVLCTANICYRCVHNIQFCLEDWSCATPTVQRPISPILYKCTDCKVQDPQLLLAMALKVDPSFSALSTYKFSKQNVTN